MKILALEFSSLQRSVAVIETTVPKNRADRPDGVNEIVQTGGVGSNLLGLIDAALQQAGVEREQIEVLAIGLGPGSYSGIRRAIAVAQGWELARSGGHLKLLGIGSTDCLGMQAQEEGLRGRFNVVIDAQRGEFYTATYDISSAACTNIEPLRIATLQELQKRETAGECFIGPDAARFRNGRVTIPRASTLARVAKDRNDFVSGEKLEPIYLRKTQFVKAQPARTIS
jgi:tRNA threonylcarbamoyladenosine biosynthesis protein TsaB